MCTRIFGPPFGRPRFFRLTFRPRFYNSSSCSRNEVQKKMGGCPARIYVQNFDAVLVVIVISAGDAIFAKFYQKCLKHTKLHIL